MGKIVAKNIKWIALLILGLMLYFSRGSFFNDLLRGSSAAPAKPVGGSTLTDNQAELIASSMYNAMNGPGTDEKELFIQFEKLKSEADYNKVFVAFGKRQYSELLGNSGIPGVDSHRTLTEWLANELNETEKRTFRQRFPHLNLF